MSSVSLLGVGVYLLMAADRVDGQQLMQSCTITAVDVEARTVAVRLGEGRNAKAGSTKVAAGVRITVAGRPCTLKSLPVPTQASVVYDRGLGALVVIHVTASPAAPPQAPSPAVAPFDAEKARARQQAWAAHLGVPVEMTNSIGMRFVLIPPGEFLMGSTAEQIDTIVHTARRNGIAEGFLRRVSYQGPSHRAAIRRPFYLGTCEVTQAQYQQIAGTNPSSFSAHGANSDRLSGQDTNDYPVETVSWADAADFCRRISARTVEQAAGRIYRLPTEAEWEHACRAGTTTSYWFGDDRGSLNRYAWWGRNSGPPRGGDSQHELRDPRSPHAVGQKEANPWRLHDLYGNVAEWCSDWFGAYAATSVEDPAGPSSGTERVIRGNAWGAIYAFHFSSAAREARAPDRRSHAIGFRVALDVPFRGFPPKAPPRVTAEAGLVGRYGLPPINLKNVPRANNDPVSGPWSVPPDATGWLPLFDGKNLDAWQKPGADKWKIIGGELAWQGGCGVLWTKNTFGNFILDLEVKCARRTNSGLLLRGPVDSWHGLEIQICDSYGPRKPNKYDMGALYDCQAPSLAAEKPVGEWNQLVVTYRGTHLTVALNDRQIIEADISRWTEANKNPDGSFTKFSWPLKDLPRIGCIGLQDHWTPVWYRNIRIKPLAER